VSPALHSGNGPDRCEGLEGCRLEGIHLKSSLSRLSPFCLLEMTSPICTSMVWAPEEFGWNLSNLLLVLKASRPCSAIEKKICVFFDPVGKGPKDFKPNQSQSHTNLLAKEGSSFFLMSPLRCCEILH